MAATAAPTVTRLRHVSPGWVAVELDGAAWRTLPAEAVLRAGLAVGAPVSRAQAVVLARERRRLVALGIAGRALARCELTRAELGERLRRRGIAPRDASAAVEAMGRAGAQDDGRAAQARAQAMAGRGWGDGAIRGDLRARGIDRDTLEEAIGALEPEAERAAALAAKLGSGRRAAWRLAGRGFGEESIERAIADLSDPG